MRKVNLEELLTLVEQQNYPIYKVGGTVRDSLLGIEVNDIDLVTSMPVEKLKALCEKENISCVNALDRTETKVLIISGFEVAEFRRDVYDEQGIFKEASTATIEEDAVRRDFTINSLYERFGQIFDYTNGQEDLKNKIIRTCGDPLQRFEEDSSRIIRAAYLAAKLDFSIADNLKECVKNNKHLLNNIKPALYGKMITKAIKANVFTKFLERLEELDIIFDVFPEWKHQLNSPQNPKYHHLTVWEHTKTVTQAAELRRPKDIFYILSAFCHDIGKSYPEIRIMRNGQPSDVGHEDFGSLIAKEFILRLELGKNNAMYVFLLTKFHGIQIALTNKSVTKAIRKIAPFFKEKSELTTFMSDLISIMRDDASGFAPEFSLEKKDFIDSLEPIFHQVLEHTAFYFSDLPINGNFIMENSNLRGPAIKDFLQSMINESITDVDEILTRLNKNQTTKDTAAITKIGTHNGIHHADEVFAVAVLTLIYPKAIVIRTRNTELLNTCDIVVDVGGGQYDHHTNDKEYRETGIPYASAGLIWRDFGLMLTNETQVRQIDSSLIQGIDALDNGYTLEKHKAIKDVSSLISGFNNSWDSEEDETDAFNNAVKFAQTIILNEIRRGESIQKAGIYIEEAIQNRTKKEILVLDKFCPWAEAVLTNETASDILFVIFPDKNEGYRIQAVPKQLGSFDNRKDLPRFWGGLRDDDLNAIIGIKDAIFCHPGLFIAGALSKESILKMAELALN